MLDQSITQVTEDDAATITPSAEAIFAVLDPRELLQMLAGACPGCDADHGIPCEPGCTEVADIDLDAAWIGPVTAASARLLLNAIHQPGPSCGAAPRMPCASLCL